MPDQPLLDLRIDAATYGRWQVLSDIDLQVGEGEIVGIIGPNGSGKSTLLRCIFGLGPTWSGWLAIGPHRMTTISPEVLRPHGVAFLPQRSCVFPSLSIEENLQVAAAEGNFWPNAATVNAVLHEFIKELASRRNLAAGKLSGGQRQMLGLAMTFIRSPKVVLLDEPCAGLAAAHSATLMRLVRRAVRERGAAAIIVEQRIPELLEIADRILVLRQGRLVYSGPSSELRDPSRLKQYFLA